MFYKLLSLWGLLALSFLLTGCLSLPGRQSAAESPQQRAPLTQQKRAGEIVTSTIETWSPSDQEIQQARSHISDAILYDQQSKPNPSRWANTLQRNDQTVMMTYDADGNDTLMIGEQTIDMPYNQTNKEIVQRVECQGADADDMLCQVSAFDGFVPLNDQWFLVKVQQGWQRHIWHYDGQQLIQRDDIVAVFDQTVVTKKDELLTVKNESIAWRDESDREFFVAPDGVYIQKLDIQTDISDVIVLPSKEEREGLEIGQIASFARHNNQLFVRYTAIVYAEERQQDYLAAYDITDQSLTWRVMIDIQDNMRESTAE